MASFKRIVFALLGKDPEAVVVSFWSGEDDLAQKMVEEIRTLVPDRRHYVVKIEPGDPYLQVRRAFRHLRIGQAAVLFDGKSHPLHAIAIWLAPTKILAYNQNLERHHLRLRTAIASWLFLRG